MIILLKNKKEATLKKKTVTERIGSMIIERIGELIVSIILYRFFNAHAHLREGDLMSDVIPFSAYYEYVVAMGNTKQPIITGDDAVSYYQEIKKRKPKFKPLMTIMLTNETTVETVRDAYAKGVRIVKLIPAGTSTNSKAGVKLYRLKEKYDVFREIVRLGMIFSIHVELIVDPATGKEIHPLEREARGIPYLAQLIKDFPDLYITVEHASTRALINFVKSCSLRVRATLTLHHATHTYEMGLYKNGKVKNGFFHCLPCLKLYDDMIAVREAMVSDDEHFLFGDDDAPHYNWTKKDPKTAPAGISTPSIVTYPVVVNFFVNSGKLENLPAFTTRRAIDHYGRILNNNTRLCDINLIGWPKIKIVRRNWTVAESYNDIVPLFAGQTLPWQIESKKNNLTY